MQKTLAANLKLKSGSILTKIAQRLQIPYRLAMLLALALWGIVALLVATNQTSMARLVGPLAYSVLLAAVSIGLAKVVAESLSDRANRARVAPVQSASSPRENKWMPSGLPFSLVFLMACTRVGLGAMRFERTLGRLSKWTTMGLLPDGHSILLRPFSDDPIVVNEIHNWRSYETHLIIHPGDVVIDIGAHIGVFALRASGAVGPSGRVIAVEPEAHNFELLARNCRLNRLDNVLLRNTAAGASTGLGRLRVYKNGRTTTHSLESPLTRDQPLANPDFTTADVHCETVDSIVFSSQLQNVDAIKIDVEEHEIDVLEGAREVLRVFKPRMVIEVARGKQGIVTRWLAGHDYKTEAEPKLPWIVYATPRTVRSGASSS